MGSVSASELNNVSDIENSNLIQDNNKLSSQNLEVSSNGSISQGNSYNADYQDSEQLAFGDVSYSQDGIQDDSNDVDSQNNDIVDNLTYEDDDLVSSQYVSNSDVISAQSDLLNTSLSGNDTSLYYKNGTSYKVVLVDNEGNVLANKTITFTINGNNYNRTTNSDGIASIAINLVPNKYDITAYYAGDDVYSNSSCSSIVNVLNTIEANDVVKFYKNGTQYYAKFLDGNGNPLVNTTVRFNINGVFYERNTNSSGVARLNINLLAGNYILTAYNPVNDEGFSSNINVLATIQSNDITKYYKNGTQYYAKFLDEIGNPLVNTTVRFNINGVFYERNTDGTGTARLNINLSPGNYILTAYNLNTTEELANVVKVLSTMVGNDISMYYRDGTRYAINLTDDQGNVLSNTTVRFNINGVFYDRVTDENGTARLNINLDPNEYIITASYGDLSISNKISVLKVDTSISGADAYIKNNADKEYTVTLVDNKGNPIQSQVIYFTYNNTQVSAITNENGIASITISNLDIGDYDITYSFGGTAGYNSCSASSCIHVVNSTAFFTADDLNMIYGDGSRFNATLYDINGNVLANRTVTFTINGKEYVRTTDSNGVASIAINLIPGNYLISYSYSTVGSLDYCNGSSNVVVSKQTAKINAEDLVMNPNDGSAFEITLVDDAGNYLKGIAVSFNIYGMTYTRVSDESGVAKLNINLGVGYYTISYSIDDTYYQGSGSNNILVDGTIFTADDVSFVVGSTSTFSVKLTDAKGNPISGAYIKFIFNNVEKSALTSADGVATIDLDASSLTAGDYPVSYYYYPAIGGDYENSGQSQVHIFGTISIEQLIESSKSVVSYIESNSKLPETISIDGETFTIAQFLYLAAQATLNINNSDLSSLVPKDASNPADFGETGNLGNLVNYIIVAQAIIDYIGANGIAPESLPSDVGTIDFDGLVYAFARIVAFYGSNDVMPAYVSIKSIDMSSSFTINSVNVINTETDLDKYLVSSRNCDISASIVQSLANSLTSGLSSDLEKAYAVYNYVRDSVSYSFYYNTVYGAAGTLTRGYGNCCDQAHAVVALARAAGLHARYVKGTCVFSSGSTYGHAWAQILIGNTWVVADATSSRNSLGVINNWNINSWTFRGYTSSLDW